MEPDLAVLKRALPDPQALARTYPARSYDDPWEAVTDYWRVMETASTHPELGSGAIATRLDLPRSRIRPWLDGARPDPVDAILTAHERGWFIDDFSLPATEGTALATFVTWVFTGGSISLEYRPQFVLRASDRTESHDRLTDAAEFLGVELREIERLPGRSNEFVPTVDAATFGRLLAAAGAPVGEKATLSLRLPEWIVDGPMNVKRAAAVTYVGERMSPAGVSNVFQNRWDGASDRFLDQVGQLLVDVFGGEYVVKHSHLRLDIEASTEARRVLEEYTRWP